MLLALFMSGAAAVLLSRMPSHTDQKSCHWSHGAFIWRLCCRAYWISFIPMRLMMYPVLLVQFWRVLEGYPWWDRGLVVGCQLLLCLFNYGMLPAERTPHLLLPVENAWWHRCLAVGCHCLLCPFQ